MFNRRYKDYKTVARRVFNTADGKRLLAHLKQEYVDASVFDANSPEATMYRLGQKELLQGLILFVKDDRDLDQIEAEIIKLDEEN